MQKPHANVQQINQWPTTLVNLNTRFRIYVEGRTL